MYDDNVPEHLKFEMSQDFEDRGEELDLFEADEEYEEDDGEII